MKKVNLLSKAEMRNILGGNDLEVNNIANPCANDGCTAAGGNIAHQLANGSYAFGNCNTLPVEQQVGCHNYCSVPNGPEFWC